MTPVKDRASKSYCPTVAPPPKWSELVPNSPPKCPTAFHTNIMLEACNWPQAVAGGDSLAELCPPVRGVTLKEVHGSMQMRKRLWEDRGPVGVGYRNGGGMREQQE